MFKPNKPAISEKMLKWGKLEKQKRAIEEQLAIDLAPATAVFEKATKTIVQAANLALSALMPELTVLAAEIEADVMAGCNPDTGVVELPQVVVAIPGKGARATAIAQVTGKPGARVVDPGKFFALCLAANRPSIFWTSTTVGVTKAKEAVGDHELDKISTKTTNFGFELKLIV